MPAMVGSEHDHDDRRQELAATLEALSAAKRQLVASAIVFGLEQSARPRRIDTMTAAEVELVRRLPAVPQLGGV